MEIGRLVGVAFAAMMAVYFTYSFLFPQETDFWLARNGFPILIIEGIYGAIFTFLIGRALGKETGVRYKDYSGMSDPRVSLVLIFLFAALSIWVVNPSLLWYMALSTIVKYIQSSKLPDMKFEGSEATASIVIVMFGILASTVVAPIISPFFPVQNTAYTEHFKSIGASGSIVNNPLVLVIWGVFYYLGMALFALNAPNPANKLPLIKVK